MEYAELFPANGLWCIRYLSEPMKSQVKKIFKDDPLPTPFETVVPAEVVIDRLRRIPQNSRTSFTEASK